MSSPSKRAFSKSFLLAFAGPITPTIYRIAPTGAEGLVHEY